MIGMPNPYLALAGVVALASAAGGGFIYGSRYAHGQEAQANLAALNQAIADRDAKQKTIDALEFAAAARENDRQLVVREIYRDIPKIARDPVYRNVCVSDDGVRLLDRATAAANGIGAGAAAGGPAAVPGDAANGRPDGQGDDRR